MNVDEQRELGDLNTQRVLTRKRMGGRRRRGASEAVVTKMDLTSRQKRKYDLIKGGVMLLSALAICLSLGYHFGLAQAMYTTLRFSAGSAVSTVLLLGVYLLMGVICGMILTSVKRRKLRSFAVMCLIVIIVFLIIECALVRVYWRYFTYTDPVEDAVARYGATFNFMKRHLPNYRNIMRLVFASDAKPDEMMQRIKHLLQSTENSTANAIVVTPAPK